MQIKVKTEKVFRLSRIYLLVLPASISVSPACFPQQRFLQISSIFYFLSHIGLSKLYLRFFLLKWLFESPHLKVKFLIYKVFCLATKQLEMYIYSFRSHSCTYFGRVNVLCSYSYFLLFILLSRLKMERRMFFS